MTRKTFNPKTLAPPVGHFDRAVRIGPWLFISGTSALTHKAGRIEDRKLSPTIEEQTRETLTNIQRVCEDAGYALEDQQLAGLVDNRVFAGDHDEHPVAGQDVVRVADAPGRVTDLVGRVAEGRTGIHPGRHPFERRQRAVPRRTFHSVEATAVVRPREANREVPRVGGPNDHEAPARRCPSPGGS